jgi:signal transduction histidine kinase
VGDGRAAPAAARAGDRPGPPGPALPGAEVLSKLGHELRGPLNGIVGLVRIMLLKLAAGPVDPAQQIHHLTLLRTSAEQLTATVEKVVQLARLDTGTPTPDREVTDCRELVAAVAARHGPPADGGPLLRVDLPDRPVLLPGAPEPLGRILAELVDNAVRHAGAAEILLRVRVGADAAIEVGDDGRGIPATEHQRIFQPFERGETAAGPDDHGPGLGLYLATRLAATCGLRLALRSAPGRGSTFSVHPAGPAGPAGS